MSSSPITEVSQRIREMRQDIAARSQRRSVPPPVPRDNRVPRTWKYFKPADLAGFKNLLFAAKTIVEGYYAGRHRSPFKGSAPEFVDYREYYPGDDLRSIDWKAYARTDRYYVKLFEKETDMNCYILLDRSASMGFGGAETRKVLPSVSISKLEYASLLCAALTYLMVKQGDKVGMTLFDGKITNNVPPGGTFGHQYTVLNALEQNVPGKQTAIAQVLNQALGLYKHRGLLIIISDFLDDPEAIFQSLRKYTHRGFEILLFHVLHEYECKLPPIANANFIDSETGEALTCLPRDIEDDYHRKIHEFIDTCRKLAAAGGIDYNFINTDTPYSAVLEKYLLVRGTR